MHVVADVLIVTLVLFSVRRMLWVMASWLRRRVQVAPGRLPDVLIAVAFRNEQDSLPYLLSSLDALDYDAESLSICLVDDASTDAGAGLARAWAREREYAVLITLDENLGKAEALNRALASAVGRLEVIVVYDADQCPHPDSLRLLIAPFADPTTEAVCGYRRPVFHAINTIVAYACLEAWTHQLVNLAAKETLGLNPPTMGGNCAYRRSALERIGGFVPGSFSEDTEVSLALAGSGGRTRFVREAVADHAVADSFRHYLNQRLRWSRGLMASSRHVRGLEAAFVAAGYFDRVVLLLVAVCIIGGYVSPWWLVVYAVPAIAAAITAVGKARPDLRLACTVVATLPLMFVVDVAVSVLGAFYGVTRRQIRWIDRRSAGSSIADVNARTTSDPEGLCYQEDKGVHSVEREATAGKPATLSVIVVSDYAAGEEKSWKDLRRALRGWVDQEGPPAEEFILVESSRFEGQIPKDVAAMVPNMTILYSDAESSYELKNRAVAMAKSDWVAIVDADCIPQQAWLRILRADIAEHPDVAAFSAKTMYPGRSPMERVLGLLSRSYIDPGRRGPTRFISGNAAAFRRDVYGRHPLPVGLGAFASRIQSEAFLRGHAKLIFDPGLVVVHDFEGWSMERDIRRNHGYSTVITRLHDERLPYARLVRAGVIAIPLIVAGKILNSVRDCLRCFRQYNVKPHELPLALALTVVTHVLEIPGMLAAYRGQAIGATAWR